MFCSGQWLVWHWWINMADNKRNVALLDVLIPSFSLILVFWIFLHFFKLWIFLSDQILIEYFVSSSSHVLQKLFSTSPPVRWPSIYLYLVWELELNNKVFSRCKWTNPRCSLTRTKTRSFGRTNLWSFDPGCGSGHLSYLLVCSGRCEKVQTKGGMCEEPFFTWRQALSRLALNLRVFPNPLRLKGGENFKWICDDILKGKLLLLPWMHHLFSNLAPHPEGLSEQTQLSCCMMEL